MNVDRVCVHQCVAIVHLCFAEARMSVGFIGAGQLAHALVKGFTAAGKGPLFTFPPSKVALAARGCVCSHGCSLMKAG